MQLLCDLFLPVSVGQCYDSRSEPGVFNFLGSVCIPGVYMPIMLISLAPNIDPNDVVDPTGVDTRVPIV